MDEELSLDKILGTLLKWAWISLLLVSTIVRSYEDQTWMVAYKNIDWGLMAVDFVVIVLLIIFINYAYKLNPSVMGFGLFRIFNVLAGKPRQYHSNGTPKMEGKNLNLLGTDIKYFGIIMSLVLLTGLPRWAMMEEELFRVGTLTWQDAIVRSLAFGFVHMLVGVPFVAALGLSGVGLFFTLLYFIGGVELSAQGHFQYNLIVFSVILLAAIVKSFAKVDQTKTT